MLYNELFKTKNEFEQFIKMLDKSNIIKFKKDLSCQNTDITNNSKLIDVFWNRINSKSIKIDILLLDFYTRKCVDFNRIKNKLEKEYNDKQDLIDEKFDMNNVSVKNFHKVGDYFMLTLGMSDIDCFFELIIYNNDVIFIKGIDYDEYQGHNIYYDYEDNKLIVIEYCYGELVKTEYLGRHYFSKKLTHFHNSI